MAGKVEIRHVWRNGEIVDASRSAISLLTFTLHYGFGVFEGIRGRKGVRGGNFIFRLADHVGRLFNSAGLMGIKIPYTPEQIIAACIELYRAEELRQGGYIRPIVFVGDGDMGLGAFDNPLQVMIMAWPWGKYLGDGSGARLAIERKYFRPDLPGGLSDAKRVAGYDISTIVKKRAKARGYDDAVMLDPRGRVSECTGMNVYMVRGRTIVTPPAETNCLKGFTRDSIFTIARDMGLVVQETIFEPVALTGGASEVFVSGTAAEVTPVVEIEGILINNGAPGSITLELQRRFQAIATGAAEGESWDHPEWRTPVNFTGV